MNPSFIAGLISALKVRASHLREESEKNLIKATCTSVAILISSVLGLASYFIAGPVAVGLVMPLSAGILIPIALLVAISIFNYVKKSWVTSGDIFQRLRYLDYEYYEEVRRISSLPLSDTQKQRLTTATHEKYISNTADLRDRIRNLDNPNATNLNKLWGPLPSTNLTNRLP